MKLGFASLFWAYGKRPIFSFFTTAISPKRVIDIPVEPWTEIDFDRVIQSGSRHLNIEIPPTAVAEFKTNAYGNVGMLQEFLKVFCEINEITETLTEVRRLGNGAIVEQTFAKKLASQRGRLLQVLQGIAGNSRTDGDDPLILPYYLVKRRSLKRILTNFRKE